MFSILKKPEDSKLAELSIKQRDMLLAYWRDSHNANFPPLPRVTRQVAVIKQENKLGL